MTVDDDNSIYVGGLPYDCTESQVRRVFELYGSVLAVKIINARDVGGKCYGFVTFTNPRSSVEAISEMDGKTIGGRVVRVNEVKSRVAGGRSMQGREGFRNNWRDHDSDGGRSRGREKAYGRDMQHDISQEIGESQRWSDRSRDRHHSRDNIQGRDRGQSRDIQNWEHPSSRKHDRESDRDYDLDASNDHSRNNFQGRDRDQHRDTQNWENQSSGKHDRESDRDYDLDASNDHSRDNLQVRDRDQHRDMQNLENQSSRKHDRESDREYDLDATNDTQLDRVVEHDRWGQKDKDHQTKRKHSSSYDRPSREHSSESSAYYHQEEQLDSLLKTRDELHKEKYDVEQNLQEKKQLIVDLQKRSLKLEDSLTSAKKLSSMHQLQLTKLYNCFQQVKDYGEKLKSSEKELQDLVDSVSMEIDPVSTGAREIYLRNSEV